MDSAPMNLKDNEDAMRSASTSSSNQLFMSESLDLPDDTFRMSLDCISAIGENVTIGERDPSIDNITNNMVTEPFTPCNTPLEEIDTTLTPAKIKSPPIKVDTPQRSDDSNPSGSKSHNSLPLSLPKVTIDDGFLRLSPERDLADDNVTDNMIIETETPCNTPLELETILTPSKTMSPPINIETPKWSDELKQSAIDDGFFKTSAKRDVSNDNVTEPETPCHEPLEAENTLTPTKTMSPPINFDTPKRSDDSKQYASKSRNLLPLSLPKDSKDDGFGKQSLEIMSNDNITNNMVTEPLTPCNTPLEVEANVTPTRTMSPPVNVDTPKSSDDSKGSDFKPHNLLKLSLTKNIDDRFVKPSPVADLMSPAKMLQFEIDIANSSTPTMKRAAIDFNFFNENSFEEYFVDVPQVKEIKADTDTKVYKETPVIVKASTVRHEIGYGKFNLI